MGGDGGKGEGPTVIFDHSTNKLYVRSFPVPLLEILSHDRQCKPGPRVINLFVSVECFFKLNHVQARRCSLQVVGVST